MPDFEDLGCLMIGGIALIAILLFAACVIGVIVVGAALY